MKVLVLGSGGREHALCYVLARSSLLKKLYCLPGNGGISEIAEIPQGLTLTDFEGIKEFCLKEKIDLVIPGPEDPLVRGIRDYLQRENISVFGPDKYTAQLEGSKAFAKGIMEKAGVPTADFKVFEDYNEALEYLRKKGAPVVIKADGLCAGKGVFVCDTEAEAKSALEKIFIERIFGEAGSKVVIEDKLEGEEASYIVITDGENFKALPTSQDHKRLLDNDEGPNTGGMGAYSPAPLINEDLRKKIEERVIAPVLRVLKEEGHPYLGFLYAGLMISKGEPYVLEFNCRLGDPETQAILPRIEGDFLELIQIALEGKLSSYNPKEIDKACVCVVVASKGYPGSYEKGKVITGLERVKNMADIMVFHAGTKKEGDTFYTNGGRVFGVTALGNTISQAIQRAYEAVNLIHFEGAYYRKDIGKKAEKYL
ncbi:phosphoribosylamine--glycine ligase [Caldimicrobium thiodismutans]|uniref:Phosphoribosylamine--glycine ligase n=1 Tax=Caldimicrobium thiodismutans TaxID=1653476 RepID=A0A0U5AK47_9BACT|nr:phosphoribosylamine--glycine ligase [Caldimicrobium thiodismutans]BAU22468.1 phosphoribosylamine--glycine ligase [Caldimicrobium thiodismutans]